MRISFDNAETRAAIRVAVQCGFGAESFRFEVLRYANLGSSPATPIYDVWGIHEPTGIERMYQGDHGAWLAEFSADLRKAIFPK